MRATAVKVAQNPQHHGGASAGQRVEQAQLKIFLKGEFQDLCIFTRGVEVIEQYADAHAAPSGFAQGVEHALQGVIGKDGVVLDIQGFLRRLDQRHAAGKRQFGIADQCKAGVIVGAC